MFKLNNLTVKNFMSVGNSTQALDFNRNDLTDMNLGMFKTKKSKKNKTKTNEKKGI